MAEIQVLYQPIKIIIGVIDTAMTIKLGCNAVYIQTVMTNMGNDKVVCDNCMTKLPVISLMLCYITLERLKASIGCSE